MDGVTLAGVAAVPLIVGLVQVLKGVGLGDRWAPVGALLIGLGLRMGWELQLGGTDLYGAVVGGLALGLAASGLYSGAKQVGVGPERESATARETDGDSHARAG